MTNADVNLRLMRERRVAYIFAILFVNSLVFAYYMHHLMAYGYLPSAFVYDKSDTFMDFFNVLYWAYDSGRYTDWGAVYPPMNFIAIRLANFLFNGGGFGDPTIMRDNSLMVIMAICIGYLIIPVFLLNVKYWRDFTNKEKILLYFVIISSSPMLFTLERGNLILIAPLFLALSISKTGLARCTSIALLINIKPYFVLLMIYYVIRGNWRGFLICTIITSIIFFSTGLLLDENFLKFFFNILKFSKEDEIFSLREIMALPSSISAFSYVLRSPEGAIFAHQILNFEQVAYLINTLEAMKWSLLVFSLIVLYSKANLISDSEIFSLVTVFISNLGIWVGGYTFILYAPLIPVLIKMRMSRIYLSILVLIALPLDIIPLLEQNIGEQFSFLAASYVDVNWTWGLGSVLRPIVNICLIILLFCEFLMRSPEKSFSSIKILS